MTAGTEKEKVLVIAGPTAAGKTAAAIEIAGEFGAEIISADSMQVYRRMDIGTAKPSAAERRLVPHHLIDVVEPDEEFNAGRFVEMAADAISEIGSRGKRLIVCGGTGLYLKALLNGLCVAPPSDPGLRSELKNEASGEGLSRLYTRLLKEDPESAARISPADAARIVRALEVFELTGVSLSEFQRKHGFQEEKFIALKVFLSPERQELYRRIEARCDKMIAAGFVEEVGGLLDMGYGRELKSMHSIGYRQIASFLAGEIGLEEAVLEIKRETRRFAKRQFTWFRREHDMLSAADINETFVREKIAGFW
jgi:tRNA dimethylallyltransferase